MDIEVQKEMCSMIATEAALYGRSTTSGSGVTSLVVCGCGQEIGTTERRHCPRCGCNLDSDY
jgi:hypothetical protein